MTHPLPLHPGARLPCGVPVGQRSGEVVLDVGVHDGLEMLELAVLQQVYDVNLRTEIEILTVGQFRFFLLLNKVP